MKTFTNNQRLSKLGLESFERRRLRADLLFTYRIVSYLFSLNTIHTVQIH